MPFGISEQPNKCSTSLDIPLHIRVFGLRVVVVVVVGEGIIVCTKHPHQKIAGLYRLCHGPWHIARQPRCKQSNSLFYGGDANEPAWVVLAGTPAGAAQ